jgi:hypothetical protein
MGELMGVRLSSFRRADKPIGLSARRANRVVEVPSTLSRCCAECRLSKTRYQRAPSCITSDVFLLATSAPAASFATDSIASLLWMTYQPSGELATLHRLLQMIENGHPPHWVGELMGIPAE